MYFKERNWICHYQGNPYRGEVGADGTTPEGLGCMAFPNTNGEISLLHLGFFHEGKPEGRGYRMRIVEQEVTYTRERTYEEVMETASFDCCGRPIAYESDPITITKVETSYRTEQDGLWHEGKFVEKVNRNLTPWRPYNLVIEWHELMDGRVNMKYLPTSLQLREVKADGSERHARFEQMRITPLNEEQLMVQDGVEIFLLRHGDEHIFNDDENPIAYNRYLYRLEKAPRK